MAHEEQEICLQQGVDGWNAWRAEHPSVTPDLSGARLRGLDLSDADLAGANLSGADLRGTVLRSADLSGANLDGANMFKAVIDDADLAGANLLQAQFLNCAQLESGRHWESAYREEILGCGAAIPSRQPPA